MQESCNLSSERPSCLGGVLTIGDFEFTWITQWQPTNLQDRACRIKLADLGLKISSRKIHLVTGVMSNQSHISQHLRAPNRHAKALVTTSQHDCQDLSTMLLDTTTMFCISVSLLGARRRNNIWGEIPSGLAWGWARAVGCLSFVLLQFFFAGVFIENVWFSELTCVFVISRIFQFVFADLAGNKFTR